MLRRALVTLLLPMNTVSNPSASRPSMYAMQAVLFTKKEPDVESESQLPSVKIEEKVEAGVPAAGGSVTSPSKTIKSEKEQEKLISRAKREHIFSQSWEEKPTVQQIETVHVLLKESFGSRPPIDGIAQAPVLDSLVATILSQNTTDVNSGRAFASLKQKFPTWEQVRTAPDTELEEAIRCGGLAKIKAGRIKGVLNHLYEERGEASLEHLRAMTDEEIRKTLSQYKGIGPKTISCVLMFCLQRPSFPVDTHVHRISQRLGWVPAKCNREETHAHLEQKIPDALKHEL